MARFDLFRNPNPRGTHALFLDVQSDLVLTATRWCVPLALASELGPVISRAQMLVAVLGEQYVVDAPNVLAVPASLLRQPVARLPGDAQLQVETVLDFMLRGY